MHVTKDHPLLFNTPFGLCSAGSESVEAEHETDKGLLQGLDKGLEAARKQMDGLKSMFGAGLKGMFGGKDKGAKAEEKEQVGAGGKGRK